MEAELRRIDHEIRAGKIGEARKALEGIALRKVRRQDAVWFASLARRVGHPLLGVRKLNPFIRASTHHPENATDEERAEYAACLSRLGAYEEALGLLRSIDSASVPQALLFEAYVLIGMWEYEAAIPLLEQFLQSSGADYEKWVAKVNLLAALVYERHQERAERLLQEVLFVAEKEKLELLRGNALGYGVANAIFTRNWAEAERLLSFAEPLLKQVESLDALFLRKWRDILELMREGATPGHLAELHTVRRLAEQWGHWETVRAAGRRRAFTPYRRATVANPPAINRMAGDQFSCRNSAPSLRGRLNTALPGWRASMRIPWARFCRSRVALSRKSDDLWIKCFP